MRRISSFLILTMAFLGVVDAADQADIDAFNFAWYEYTAAAQRDDLQQQVTTAEIALLAGRKALGDSDERVPLLMVNLGAAYLKAQKKDAAKEVLEEALAITQELSGKRSEKLLQILPHLADAKSDGATNVQLRVYKRALKIAIEHYSKESDEYASLALRTGINVYRMSATTAARRYIVEAHKYFLSTRGPADFDTALAAFHIGKYNFSKHQYKESIEYLLDALASFESIAQDTTHYQMVSRALLVQAYENRGDSELATQHCVAIGRMNALLPEADFYPIFRMAPSYPSEALHSGKQGHVDFLFTVDADGFVREPEILDSSKNSRSLRKAALAAVERFRYAPRIVDGEPVAVDGVETRISFAIQ